MLTIYYDNSFEVGNNKNLFKKTVFADRVGGQLRRIGDQHICGGKSKTAVRFFGRNTWLEKLFQREKKRLRRVFNMKITECTLHTIAI